jgi:hypothetical protein
LNEQLEQVTILNSHRREENRRESAGLDGWMNFAGATS